MKTATVTGTVVSSIQHSFFDGHKQLLCRLLDHQGRPTARTTIAVDTVDAGVGDTVLILDEGNSARQILRAPPDAPIRALVVGIVDDVTIERA